jgi:hypothetical protein
MIVVDGHLLAQARDGNREAIRQIAKIAADHLRRQAARRPDEPDDVTPFLTEALERMAGGRTPNDAFRWGRNGRQPANESMIRWTLAMHVEALIHEGFSDTDAIALVGEAANKGADKGGTVDKAFREYQHQQLEGEDFPPDLFPIHPTARETIKNIDRRVAELAANRRPWKKPP